MKKCFTTTHNFVLQYYKTKNWVEIMIRLQVFSGFAYNFFVMEKLFPSLDMPTFKLGTWTTG